jgi:catalase
VSTPVADISERLVDGINATYGVHPGHRAVHAKGVLCAATFTPTADAATLSRAPHFAAPETRAHVRFSNGSGRPDAPDGGNEPRGIGVKFYLDGGTTDIVGLSLPVFFTRTPEDLLAFNVARRVDPATGELDMAKVGEYLGAHPEAMPAVTATMSHPIPASYAGLTYHGIHAFKFVAADGGGRHGRYRLVPAGGDESLSPEEAAARGDDYMVSELAERLAVGPAAFDLVIQLAEEGDPIDDPTAAWPDDRRLVTVGRLTVTALAYDRETDGDVLVFDPTRVPDGIELTDDPILLARPGAYSVSVARRRSGIDPG